MAGNNNDNEKRPPWHENRDPLLRRLQKSVHFVKTVTSSNVGRQLAIPTWFVIKHGDKFEQTILLRSGILPVSEPWHVRLSLSKRSLKSPQVILAGGWPKFVAVHGLAEGDDLLFSLRAMSEFDVYVFRKPPPPPDWSRGFDDEVPQRKTGGCTSEHSDEGVSTTTKEPFIGEDNGPIYAFRGRTKIGTCASTYDLHYLVQRDLHEPQCLRSDVSLILDRKNDGNPKAFQEKAETKTASCGSRETISDSTSRTDGASSERIMGLSSDKSWFSLSPPTPSSVSGKHKLCERKQLGTFLPPT